MNRLFSDAILGQDNAFLSVIEQTSKAAKLNKPVLIIGERGTGKELIAHRLHYLSPRWQEPFITLNCAALSEQLLDSELFGHEAGAFTGAQKQHQGRFERADRGTLFLDELGNAPMLVQEKLLRVIEYGQLERVGGSKALTVDVRLVCATNEDLPDMAKRGEFRADLLDRLAFDVIHLPPLRSRRSDIPLLANHFAQQMCRELGWEYFPGFSDIALDELLTYGWPGNIRELKNSVERSIYRHDDRNSPIEELILNPFASSSAHVISEPFQGSFHTTNLSAQTEYPAPIPEQPKSERLTAPLPINLHDYLEQEKHKYLEAALQQAKYHHKTAAQLLGLTYHQFRAMIRKTKSTLE